MNTIEYKVVNGTSYHAETDPVVIHALECARKAGDRVYLRYGDLKTGKDWLDEFEVEGTIGRSMGPVKIPLLIHNSRSLGGGGILDHRILRIATKDRVLYESPVYQRPKFGTGPSEIEGYAEAGTVDGSGIANFQKKGQAARWVKKMQRYCGVS